MERATFGAGCFWGVEEAFRTLDGVLETAVGYMGGDFENPTYRLVCSGETGHAEVVDIQFDPNLISYQQLLDKFWKIHNPTTVNRQGWDIGPQYRSVIFYHNEQQRQFAEQAKEKLATSDVYSEPIVTEVAPAGPFWRGEEYHQRYLQKSKPG